MLPVGHFLGELLGELDQVDHDASMCAEADFLGPVHCAHAKFEVTTGHAGDLGERNDLPADRVAARCRTSTLVPTALSPGSK